MNCLKNKWFVYKQTGLPTYACYSTTVKKEAKKIQLQYIRAYSKCYKIKGRRKILRPTARLYKNLGIGNAIFLAFIIDREHINDLVDNF